MPLDVAIGVIERFNADGRLKEVIPSTMGEPLLYMYFKELLEYCGSAGIPINITTNGTFPGFWGTDEGMALLLRSCSDIKISCMAFDACSMAEMMPGVKLHVWKENVCRLLELQKSFMNCGTVSLQVTLHRMLVPQAENLLRWAEEAGVQRIKWNLPVFLNARKDLALKYGIDLAIVPELRKKLASKKLRSEGSLYFEGEKCNFCENEAWIMPDGTMERCPNPERRFGDALAPGASCEKCILFHP